MRVSKEVRIGILVMAALVIFFVGFSFLKGAKLLSNDKVYYGYYTDVDGLQKSANVQISGMTIGRVSEMKLDDDGKRVRVSISMNKKIRIPVGTIARITSPDLLGGKVVRLDLGSGPGDAAPGSTLATDKDGGAIDNISGELTPRLHELKATITTLDSTLAGINNMVNAQNQQAISAAISSIKATADNMAALTGTLSAEGAEIKGIIHSANSITSNLEKSNDTVRRILSNVNKLSGQLANAPVEQTVNDLRKVSAQLQGVMDKASSKDGTVGMLLNDKEAYNNLNNSLHSLNSLIADIQAHPKRYVSFSVFGGKQKK